MSSPALFATLGSLLLAGDPAHAADRMLVGRTVQSFSGPTDDPMVLPTAVASAPGGGIFVADGVKDRVLHFADDGSLVATVQTVAGLPLSNPTAVATSADGWLWIADTGNGRVAVLPPAPGLDQSISPPPDVIETPDLTGVAVSEDGSTLWIVDNDAHAVLRYDVDRDSWLRLGEQGHGMGQLHHPFLASTTPDGELWVSDVINGRLQAFTETGAPLRTAATFGVTPGQLFRPKGVAADGETVYASDSVLGVIQAFTPGGRLVDVLRDESGAVLHLEAPTGLAVQGDFLYVVELGASSVRKLELERELGRPYQASTHSGISSSSEGAGCQSCHLEMVPEMSRGVGNLLAPMPPSTSQAPWVASDDSCLSCHDGSVLDSRREVWHLHGHPIELDLPSDMVVPDDLPLTDGQLACRTCHSAHTLGGSGQVHRNALMLRVTNEPVELCIACHGDMMDGGEQ